MSQLRSAVVVARHRGVKRMAKTRDHPDTALSAAVSACLARQAPGETLASTMRSQRTDEAVVEAVDHNHQALAAHPEGSVRHAALVKVAVATVAVKTVAAMSVTKAPTHKST